jgi:outer membrane immunogenic protein
MWCCVRVLLLVAVSAAISTSAHAQNPQRWNGPYIGANIGYGWADIGGSVTAVDQNGNPVFGPASHSIDADGMFGGVQVGFNRRMGNFFVGLEADLQTADISGSSSTPVLASSASVDWFGTARVRGGFATDTMLIYATGGLAFGHVDFNATYNNGGALVSLSGDGTQLGFVLGAGVELALRSNWSLKIEYQYLNFGDQSASDSYSWTTGERCPTTHTNTVTTDIDTDIHTLRVGLNYSFGAPPRHQPLKP